MHFYRLKALLNLRIRIVHGRGYEMVYSKDVIKLVVEVVNRIDRVLKGVALINIAASAQELLVGVVELLASAVLLIIALTAVVAFVKVFVELGRYGY